MLSGKKKPSKRSKDTAKSALSESAAILAGALFSLGLDTGDDSLRSRFNVSLSIVSNKISVSGLISLSKDMLAYANDNIGKLKEYSITPEFLSSMEIKLSALERSFKSSKK